jgi:hypothetical protein
VDLYAQSLSTNRGWLKPAYRLSQLESTGKIMSKKITWPSLFFEPINLWNCPRQDELREINYCKSLVKCHREIEDRHRRGAEKMEAAIKEREFLYYLRSGRFPE